MNPKMALKNLSRPSGSWVIDLNIALTVLIHNLNCPMNPKMALKNLSRPSGSWIIDLNIALTVLIHNLNFYAILEFLGQLTLRCMHYFSKKGW